MLGENTSSPKGSSIGNFDGIEEKTIASPCTDLDQEVSKSEAVLIDHGADTRLHRTLGTRHLTMVSLGSSIGMGMWLGSGESLIDGGPAALFIGFIITSTIVWGVAHSIGEMATTYPLPSAFIQWTSIFISPAAGLALGYSYVMGNCITIANEIQGAITVMSFWTDDVPKPAWICIFWLIIVLINIWAVKYWGEFEVVSSTIKFSWMIIVIISLIVVTAGGAPQGGPIGFRYWKADAFTNGFKGFLSVFSNCVFAMAGMENVSFIAAEVSSPRKSVPRAVKSIWPRLTVFYVLGSLLVTLTVSPKDPDLFGGSGSNASPFVIAYRNAGIPAMVHITNAVILISVISMGSISAYGCSRMLVGLARLGMVPKVFEKVDKTGRPWVGCIFALSIGFALALMNLSYSGAKVFGWLSNLVSLQTLIGWATICLVNLRFRAVWKAQGRSKSEIPWRSWTFPFATYWSLGWCILLLIMEFYLSVWPFHEVMSAKNFFASYISVIATFLVWVGAQIWYRCRPWKKTADIDLDESRRFYADHTDEESKLQGSRVGRLMRKGVSFVVD